MESVKIKIRRFGCKEKRESVLDWSVHLLSLTENVLKKKHKHTFIFLSKSPTA